MMVRLGGLLSVFLTVSAFSVAQAEEIIGTAEILTGETLKIQGQIFRLAGIDAPEVGQSCQNKTGKIYDCGRIAATGLMDLTAGAIVRCHPVASGTQPPVLARCHVDGYDLSEGMVYTGWAVQNPTISDSLKVFQAKAKKKHHGLWAGQFEMPWVWKSKHP